MRKRHLKKSLIASLLSVAMIITTAGSVFAVEVGSVSGNDAEAELEAEAASLQSYSGIPAAGAPDSNANCDFDYMSNVWMPAQNYAPVAETRNTVDAFKKTTTKKGVQGLGDTDATNWNGSQNTLYNVKITDYIWSPTSGQGMMRWDYNGEAYYYNVNQLFALIYFVQTANKNGVTVSMQMEVPYKEGMEILIDPTALANKGSESNRSEYYAPNTGEGAKYFAAFFDMMADIFSRTNCHVDNWVLGNEVNAPNAWNFTGSVDVNYNVDLYTKSYLELYKAVRKYSDVARVSVCLDHSWQHDDLGRAITTKDFLNRFHANLAGTAAASDWCLAYHMYPSILEEPDIWTVFAHVTEVDLNPKSADARLVDGYNYSVMTDYIKENFGTSHRIMCTEEGFSDVFGDDVQAASLALSYYAAKYDSMTDCFVIACKNAGATVNFDIRGKLAETIYQKLDSDPAYVEAKTLSVIGVSSFADIVSGYGRSIDETKTKAFVSRIYELALKREYGSSEVDYWKDELANGVTGAEVAGGFFFSPEMEQKNLSDKDFLVLCYEVLMDRTPDEGEMEYWLDAMKEGFGREGVFNNFCQSEEFTGICMDTGIIAGEYPVHGRSLNMGLSGFMSRLYTKALGRDFDKAGMDYWCDEYLNGHYSLLEISTNQFFHSPEFEAKGLSEEEYIDVLYRTFFGRDCDDAERAYWINELHTEKDKDAVLADFSVCPEFGQIKASYNLK